MNTTKVAERFIERRAKEDRVPYTNTPFETGAVAHNFKSMLTRLLGPILDPMHDVKQKLAEVNMLNEQAKHKVAEAKDLARKNRWEDAQKVIDEAQLLVDKATAILGM